MRKENVRCLLKRYDLALSKGCPVTSRMLPHAPEQFHTRDPIGKARVVSRLGNRGQAALTSVHNHDGEKKAREIDRCRQPCGSAPDHQLSGLSMLYFR